VATVERLLPRHWDGRRLLHFLAGLALLAMSFTLRADVVATPAVPAPASASARSSVEAPETETDQADLPVAAPAVTLPVSAAVVAVEPGIMVEPGVMVETECQHHAGPRAPPLA
jgi:hypothetical protein